MTGYIHSMESMGLVDGPGVRAVVFLQGCPLRCRYCHNPDTQCRGGRPVEDGTLVRRLLRFRSYFDRSGGGVTFSGGEPLAQPDFLLACLRRLKAEGVHTCLDTSGAGRGIYGEILAHTDLVLYDVKHHEPAGYKAVTGGDMAATLDFVEAVRRRAPHVGPPRGGPRPHRQPGPPGGTAGLCGHPAPCGAGRAAALPQAGGPQV